MGEIVVLDEQATSEARWGCHPVERTIEQRLAAGWLLVDKPAGPSSHQISAWARDMIGLDKMGHGGTLDPFATGALILLCGSAMRLTKRILKGSKKYVCVLRFPVGVEMVNIEKSISQMRGSIHNVPPKESAVKIQVRQRTIDSFSILDAEGRIVVVEIECDAGTYIRTMARDLGLLLGGPVELLELRRSRTSEFEEVDAVQMQDLADAIWMWKENDDTSAIMKIVQPLESLLSHLPRIVVKDGAAAALAHGAPLARPGIVSIDSSIKRGDEVLLVTLKDEAVSLAIVNHDAEKIVDMKSGEVASSNTVLMPTDTYPKRW